jgi:hypothetical protein
LEPTPAEQLFEICLGSIIEDGLTEADMLAIFADFTKNKTREPQEDGRLFLYIGGAFFRATMIFNARQKTMYSLNVEVGEQAFSEMRAFARAKQMQAMADPTEGVKVEWIKGMLGGKHQLVLKQFIGRPMEVVASFINIFGHRTVFFNQRELS